MPLGLPLAATKACPALKYGIMSTTLRRSGLMFWAEMITSHLPPVRAGMIVLKTEFWTTSVKPRRVAISWMMSTSDPCGLPLSSKLSCGGYGMSMQATSLPVNISWSVGTVATGLAAVDGLAPTEVLGLVPVLAVHAARMRRATIAPIAPFRRVRCILVLHRPYRAKALGKLGCRCNLLPSEHACRGQA